MKHFSSSPARAVLVTIFAFAASRFASAETTILFPVADTYMNDSQPASNFGAANPLLVGISANGSPRHRCLLKFSLDNIPAGAVVTDTTLRLIAVAGPREPYEFELNRLLVEWTEGGASWLTRLPATPWTAVGAAAGTDFVATPSATAELAPVPVPVSMGGQPVTNNFSSPGMITDVQLWLDDPDANFGWILHVAGGQAASGRQLASREDATLKPVLIVDYTVAGLPAPATPPTLFGPVLEAGSIQFSFSAQSNRTYTIEYRNLLTTGAWAVVTNIPAQPADTTVSITEAVTGIEGYFRVRTP